jgi:signal transduction histidine kinase
VTVELSLATDLPDLPLDPRQIEQAVTNLALNALQAMADGGRLTINTCCRGPSVEIAVRDTGPGVPEDLGERIWEPFFSTKATGTGLGLPLVQEIAAAHGGRVGHSRSGGETVFLLELPASSALGGGPSTIKDDASPAALATENGRCSPADT